MITSERLSTSVDVQKHNAGSAGDKGISNTKVCSQVRVS